MISRAFTSVPTGEEGSGIDFVGKREVVEADVAVCTGEFLGELKLLGCGAAGDLGLLMLVVLACGDLVLTASLGMLGWSLVSRCF